MWFLAARRGGSLAKDLDDVWSGVHRHARGIIVIVALSSAAVTAAFSTRSAAGADASGYISEAAMFARGDLTHHDELFELTQGHDPFLTSPLGWRPSPRPAAQSPTYPPGLPLLMTLPHAVAGVRGASAVVTASAAIGVVAAGFIGLRLGGPIAGIIAATLLAFTPVFLYQSIQPMSDVPVTAAWVLCFLLLIKDRSLAAGFACAAAVLIRPNLAPLAIVPLYVSHQRLAFAAPVALSAMLLGASQWWWYGSPLRSGYGSSDELFAFANVVPNATRYSRWLLATAPVLLFGFLGIARMRSSRTVQALTAFAVLVIASYLIYAVFDDWSYLRFLLPALAMLAVLAGVELAAWIGKWPANVRAPMLYALLLAVVAHALWTARAVGTFELADRLHRVEQAADFINAHVPANAVLIAGEQSGSMRYYTGRPIVRWEAASAVTLPAAVATLENAGRPVYIVLDAWEHASFRTRFGGVTAVALDWPAAFEAGSSLRTRVWRLSDRERFLRGESLTTVKVP